MNDIVQSQEKSMEGHLQFLFKVRGLKSKSTKQSTKHQWNFVGGGASKKKRAMEGTWIFSGTAHYCKCKIYFVSFAVEVWTN